jgi:transcription antitermination factor NusG
MCVKRRSLAPAATESGRAGAGTIAPSAQLAPMLSDSQPWFAIYTRHQHERIVASALSSKGFSVYLPLYWSRRQRRDRTTQLSVPLFPCYVFLRGGLDRRLSVLTTPGVCRFVAQAGHPAAIPEEEVDAIKRITTANSMVERYPFLKSGDRVRIKSGALEGIEGFLVRQKSSLRLVLSVSLLGSSASVEVDYRDVERAMITAGRPVAATS